jgi:hypothetical protein
MAEMVGRCQEYRLIQGFAKVGKPKPFRPWSFGCFVLWAKLLTKVLDEVEHTFVQGLFMIVEIPEVFPLSCSFAQQRAQVLSVVIVCAYGARVVLMVDSVGGVASICHRIYRRCALCIVLSLGERLLKASPKACLLVSWTEYLRCSERLGRAVISRRRHAPRFRGEIVPVLAFAVLAPARSMPMGVVARYGSPERITVCSVPASHKASIIHAGILWSA